METETNQQIAEHTLNTLKAVRFGNRETALNELNQLLESVGNTGVQEHKRAAAWLAIRRIWMTLSDRPHSPLVSALWDDAITKTEVWKASIS
jgi:hypothetical protein